VQYVAVNGYLCSHQVFVHARDERTDAVLEEMKVDDDRYQVQMNEQQEIMQWADGPEHREAEQALEQLEQQRDEDINRILEKLSGARVVIVSFCSC
jgi:exosome complex RNA-binding protein Rrp42 (RNase PH superfamily)